MTLRLLLDENLSERLLPLLSAQFENPQHVRLLGLSGADDLEIWELARRDGVLWHEPSQTDLLFVTLNKSEALFSPSTRYRDLALGRYRRGGCRGWGWRFENSQTGPTKGPAP